MDTSFKGFRIRGPGSGIMGDSSLEPECASVAEHVVTVPHADYVAIRDGMKPFIVYTPCDSKLSEAAFKVRDTVVVQDIALEDSVRRARAGTLRVRIGFIEPFLSQGSVVKLILGLKHPDVNWPEGDDPDGLPEWITDALGEAKFLVERHPESIAAALLVLARMVKHLQLELTHGA
jgi:hypothetical protein